MHVQTFHCFMCLRLTLLEYHRAHEEYREGEVGGGGKNPYQASHIFGREGNLYRNSSTMTSVFKLLAVITERDINNR